MKLPQLIRQETREMIRENDLVEDADAVNAGFCQPLAREVANQVPDAEVYSAWGGMGSRHFFIKYNGKYYDAERPSGVKRVRDLPYFGSKPHDIKRVTTQDPEFM